MAYKPTERKYRLMRFAILLMWPGIPVWLLMQWLTDLNVIKCVAAGVVVALVLDSLIELLRFNSDADGE
jgi:hypothetical protein